MIVNPGLRRFVGGVNGILRSLFFYAPRTSSITQTRGAGTPTITRATVATVTNNDGNLVTALSGELREQGARRVRNLFKVTSEDLTNAAQWTTTGTASAASATVALFPDNATYFQCTIATGRPLKIVGNKYVFSFKVSGSGTLDFYLNDSVGEATLRVTLSATPTVYSITRVAVAGGSGLLNTYFGRSGSTATSVTVEYVQLEDVTAQTTQTAGEYVSVGVLSSPYHGAGVDGVKDFSTDMSGNPTPAATLDGSVVEAAATQILATADIRDMTTANWTLGATMTRARTSVGADGAANSATRLTGGAVAATNTCYTTITAAASSRTYSALVKRVTGTGPVRIVQTGTETDISAQLNASGYALVQLNASVLNVAVGFKIDTNLDAIDVDFNQFEAGAYATSRMAATGAARNADVLDDQVASNLTAAAGTVAFTWTPSHDPSGTIALCGSYVDASNYIALLHDGTDYILRKRIAATNYDATLTAAFTSGTTAKISLTWGASGINLAVDGTLGTAHANTDDAQLGTRWQWGADGNGGQQAGAAFKEMYLTPRASSDSELQAITV